MRPRSSLRTSLAAFAMGLASACQADVPAPQPEIEERAEIGLMGTIPIYWGESGDFGDVLAGGAEPHWARARIEARHPLRPLDALDGGSLATLDFLILAQPRALTPAENVALDDWLRAGGKLLLFADPMLTGESRFAIGDRRRPQDVILLSPILARWGIELEFDDSAPPEYRLVHTAGGPIPVNLPGRLIARQGEADCTLEQEVLADCRIGRGRAVIVADAALLDLHEAHPAAPAALDWLVSSAFNNR